MGIEKGNHSVEFDEPEFDGRAVARHVRSLVGIGHCCVHRAELGEQHCECTGFSDGAHWKDGHRIAKEQL